MPEKTQTVSIIWIKDAPGHGLEKNIVCSKLFFVILAFKTKVIKDATGQGLQ